MARFEKSGAKRAKPHAAVAPARGRRAPTPPAIEDTMFFPRLRRHAKWMFVFLALVFGLGFVAFGVGAGGVGFGDVLKDLGGGSGAPSVSDAQKKTEENPKSIAAWEELETAYESNNDTAGAIEAQTQLVALRPKDADALRHLAVLQIQRLSELQTQASIIQSNAAINAPGQAFPSLTAGGQSVFQDRIQSAIATRANSRLQQVAGEGQAAAAAAVDAYKEIVKLEPNDPGTQIELAQAAQQTYDYATAIAAYKRFLVLAPDDPSAAAVKQQLKQLQNALGSSG